MLVASVIVDVSARAVDRAFDYLVPQELLGVEVGCAVSVDFGNRPVVGYVVALRDEQDGALDISKYKYLAGILSTPYFDAVSAQLAMWIADEYAAPLSECVRLLTPPGGAPKIKRVDGKWTLVGSFSRSPVRPTSHLPTPSSRRRSSRRFPVEECAWRSFP